MPGQHMELSPAPVPSWNYDYPSKASLRDWMAEGEREGEGPESTPDA